MMSRPVALGSSVPQWPTFLRRNVLRIASTTSCEVGPAGLSIRSAPSNGSNSCMANRGKFGRLFRRVQRFFYGGDDPPLDGQRWSGNPRACSSTMAASAKERRNLVHVHLLAFGTQANARQFGRDFLEKTRDDHRFNRADMVNQPFRVIGLCTGPGIILLLQPEISDLVIMRQAEIVIDMLEQFRARERIRLIDFVADFGKVRATFDKIAGNIVSAGAGAGILERAGVGGNGGEQAIGNRRSNRPVHSLHEAENDFTGGCFLGGYPVDVAVARVAGVMVNIDEQFALADVPPSLAQAFETGRIGRNNAIEFLARFWPLHKFIGIEKCQLIGHRVLIPAGDFFALIAQRKRHCQLRANAITIRSDVPDHAKGAVSVDSFKDAVNDFWVWLHQEAWRVPTRQ